MAKRRRRSKRKPSLIFSILGLLITLAIVIAAFFIIFDDVDLSGISLPDTVKDTIGSLLDEPSTPSTLVDDDAQLYMYVIDVGQGSSTLFYCDGRSVMVDAGDNGQGAVVATHLQALGIDTIDLLIATHPHADHIGGVAELMEAVDVQNFIMPDLPTSLTPTTKTYMDMMAVIESQNTEVYAAATGDVYDIGQMQVEILGPVRAFNNLNDMSVITRIVFGNRAIVVTGDAEEGAEKALLSFTNNLSADIYVAGHHGSNTSNSAEFVFTISPTYAAISAGADNSYGHPHQEILDLFESADITCYRTDISGSIMFIISQTGITVECEK